VIDNIFCFNSIFFIKVMVYMMIELEINDELTMLRLPKCRADCKTMRVIFYQLRSIV